MQISEEEKKNKFCLYELAKFNYKFLENNLSYFENDINFFRDIVKINSGMIKLTPKEFLSDKIILKNCLLSTTDEFLDFLKEIENIELIVELIDTSPIVYNYISDKLKNNPRVIKQLLQDHVGFIMISDKLKSNRQLYQKHFSKWNPNNRHCFRYGDFKNIIRKVKNFRDMLSFL